MPITSRDRRALRMLGGALILLAGCSGEPRVHDAPAAEASAAIREAPPHPRPHRLTGVPAGRKGPEAPPPGCAVRHGGATTTTTCSIDRAFEGVPLRWTSSRAEHTLAYAAAGSYRRVFELTGELRTGNELVARVHRRVGPELSDTEPPDEMVLIDYGPAVQGFRSMSLTIRHGEVTGSMNDRAIVPFHLATRPERPSITFADGKPAPVPHVDPRLVAAIHHLGSHPTVRFSLNGVPSNAGGVTDQNTPFNWATHDCQECQKDCTTSWPMALLAALAAPLAGFGGLLCSAGCWIPKVGCDQKPCSVFRACDDDQTCCGDICCDSGWMCGNDQYGACCPSDHPVACGDQTAVDCYPAGSVCCNIGTDACPPGTVCLSDGHGTTSCCPGDRFCDGACCEGAAGCLQGPSGRSVCCYHPLCGDECCPPGAVCFNGKCGYGTPCGDTFCGFGQSCCGGVCCTGVCLSGNRCCPSSQVACGDACCPRGQICTNGVCTPPQGPALMIYDTASRVLIAQSGGPALRISNEASLLVEGQGFPGSVVRLSVDRVGGPIIANVSAPGGSFATTITTQQFSAGPHKLVAISGLQTASVDLQVEILH